MREYKLYTLVRILRPTALFAVLMFAFAVTSVAVAQDGGYLLPGSVPVCAMPGENCTTRTDPVLVTIAEYDAEWVQVLVGGQLAGYVRKADLPDLSSAAPPVTSTEEVAPAAPGDESTPARTNINLPFAVNVDFSNWARIGQNFATLWSEGFWHGLIMLVMIIALFFLPYIENRIEERAEVNIRFIAIVVFTFVMAWMQFAIASGGAAGVVTRIANLHSALGWFEQGAIFVVAIIAVWWYRAQWISIWFQSGQLVDRDAEAAPETKHFKDEHTRDEWMKTDMKNEDYVPITVGIPPVPKVGYTQGKDEPAWVIVEKVKEKAREDGTYGYAALFAPWVATQLFGVFIIASPTSFMGLDIFDLLLILPAWRAVMEVWHEYGKSLSYILTTLLYGLIIAGLIIGIKLLGFQIPETSLWSNLRNLPYEIAILAIPLTLVLTKEKKRFAEGVVDLAGALIVLLVITMQVANLLGTSVASFVYGG